MGASCCRNAGSYVRQQDAPALTANQENELGAARAAIPHELPINTPVPPVPSSIHSPPRRRRSLRGLWRRLHTRSADRSFRQRRSTAQSQAGSRHRVHSISDLSDASTEWELNIEEVSAGPQGDKQKKKGKGGNASQFYAVIYSNPATSAPSVDLSKSGLMSDAAKVPTARNSQSVVQRETSEPEELQNFQRRPPQPPEGADKQI